LSLYYLMCCRFQ